MKKNFYTLAILAVCPGFSLLCAIVMLLFQTVTVHGAEACETLNCTFVRECSIEVVQRGVDLARDVYDEIDTISNAAFESELDIDYATMPMSEIDGIQLATNFGPMLNTETAPEKAVFENEDNLVGYIEVSYDNVYYFYPLWVFDKDMQRMDIYAYNNEDDVNYWLQCLAQNYPEFSYEMKTNVEAGTVWSKGITTFASGETSVITATSNADSWYFSDAVYNKGM